MHFPKYGLLCVGPPSTFSDSIHTLTQSCATTPWNRGIARRKTVCTSCRSKETWKDTLKDTRKETGKDTLKDTRKDTLKDTLQDSIKDTSKDTSKDTWKDTSKDTLKNTSKDTLKDTSKDTFKDTSKHKWHDTFNIHEKILLKILLNSQYVPHVDR
jgi:hypothetical protein